MEDKAYNEINMLQRVADGDQSAFAELFKRYFDQLYENLFKYTQRHIDAEDIVQNTFVKAWEKRAIFREVKDPMNWLFITARNEYLDRLRRNRLSDRYRQHIIEVFTDSTDTPESVFIGKESNNIYQQAISQLPEKQKQAFLLSREAGLTYEEIAAKMFIEKTTVKAHIARALQSIRTFLLSQTNQKLDIILLLIFFKML
jgi:RNA polymerase sigma-70 factor (family 1)